MKDITWATVAFTLITAASTLIGVWITQHFQFKNKQIEIDSLAKLKARELRFTAYQTRIESANQQAEKLGNTFGQFAALLQGEEDPDKQNEVLAAIAYFMKVSKEPLRIWVQELESDLQEVGLMKKCQADIEIIKKGVTIDFENLRLEDVGQLYVNFMISVALIHSTQNRLLDKKSDDLFSDYL